MDSIRMFAGIVFLLSLFLLYDAWIKQNQPPVPVATNAVTPTPSLPPVSGTPAPGATPQPGAPVAPPAGASVATPAASSATPVVVRTDGMVAEIDPVGGGVRRIELLTHKGKVHR